jgi:hypothetical protein
MLSKKKSSYLTLIKAQSFTSFNILPLFFRSGFFLSIELCKSSRLMRTTTTDIHTKLLFSSVPRNHGFRSQQRNHLLAQRQTQGSTLQQRTKKTLTTIPFGNTYEACEVSPKVEAGGLTRLRCL